MGGHQGRNGEGAIEVSLEACDVSHFWSPFDWGRGLCGFDWTDPNGPNECVRALVVMVDCPRCLVELDWLLEIGQWWEPGDDRRLARSTSGEHHAQGDAATQTDARGHQNHHPAGPGLSVEDTLSLNLRHGV